MLQVITGVNAPALNRVCGHVRLAIMVVQAFTTGAYERQISFSTHLHMCSRSSHGN